MKKAELVAAVAEKANITKKDAEAAIAAFTATVTEALKAGDEIAVANLGTFKVRERAAREGVNPATGAKIQIAASNVPAFKAGKALKDAVAK